MSIKKYLGIIFIFLLLAGFFVPQHSAKAWCATFDGCVTDFFSAMIGAVGNALGWVAGNLSDFVKPETQSKLLSFGPVYDSWAIIRNFVNMFFILILIVMAFGTIFGIENYSYRRLLAPLLIAAVFINFSYAIAYYLIGLANGLAAMFTNIIGTQDLGTRLADGLSFGKLLTGKPTLTAGTALVTFIFILIFFVIALFAMLSAFIFIVVRVPILWFILILSPLAVIASILPGTQEFWKNWKKQFIAWTFFLPIYMFFMMFAFIFIAQKPNNLIASSSTSFFDSFINLNDVFFYVVTIMFLVYGLNIAMKFGAGMDAGMAKVFGNIRGGVNKYFPGMRYGRAALEGVKARGKDIYERGVPIPGTGTRLFSEREARLREAKVAERFGGEGAKGAVEAALNKNVGIEKDRMKTRTDDELKSSIDSGSITQRLATRELLQSRGLLNKDEIIKTYEMYRNNKATSSATTFINGIDTKDLSPSERKDIYENLGENDISARKKIARVMAEKGGFIAARERPDGTLITDEAEKLEDVAKQIAKAANLFTTMGERMDILNKASKSNIEAAAKAAVELKMKDKKGNVITSNENAITELFADSVRKAKVDDLLDLSDQTLSNEEIKKIVKEKLKNDYRVNTEFLNRATKKQKDALGITTEQQSPPQPQQEPPPNSSSQPPPPTQSPPSNPVSYIEEDKPIATLTSDDNTLDLRNNK